MEAFKEQLSNYAEFFKFSFQDLVKLTKKDRELFIMLYYNRTPEYQKMKSILKNIKNRGDNILVTGTAGMGKSNFIYRIFLDDNIMKEYKIYPIIVDYRVTTHNYSSLIKFIEDIEKYFEHINFPINNLKENIDENISFNISKLAMHLSYIDYSNLDKHLVIFLDDFDYIEDDLFYILEQFLSFASSTKATIILTARPQLHAAINSYDNRFAVYFTRDVQRVRLDDLAIPKLLKKRLAMIILEKKRTNILTQLIKTNGAYTKFLKMYGVIDLEQLDKFELPFTELYYNFMTSITNGNIREIFDITYDTLIFFMKHYKELDDIVEKVEDIDENRKNIEDEHIMRLFYDKKERTSEDYLNNYHLLNIHEHTSKSGNSLMFNVLEAIKMYEYVNDTFFENLAKLGHKQKDVEKIIDILKNKSYRMIAPQKILPSKIQHKAELYCHYKTTTKGDYYLTNIVYWKEYIERCGTFGKSLRSSEHWG